MTADNLVSTVLNQTAQGVVEDLQGLSGEELNRKYMVTQIALHQQALSMLEHALIPNVENEELSSTLESARQTVEQHLDEAQDIFLQIAQEQPMPAE